MGKKIFVVASIILTIFALTAAGDYLYFRDRIYPGVTIDGVDTGYMKTQDVKNELFRQQYHQTQVIMKAEEVEQVFLLEELGLEPDLDRIVNKAYSLGRSKNYLENLRVRYGLLKDEDNISLCFHVHKELMFKSLEELESAINKKPIDAQFVVSGDKISIQPGKTGLGLDREKNKNALLYKLSYINSQKTPIEFPLIKSKIEPEITTEILESKGIENLVASFSTNFGLEDVGRVHNIKLAGEKLDYFILPPGKNFSFNREVGRITAERGFKEAPIILEGELVPGIGGGVCQVSSTLYNTALLSGLEIKQRVNHSRPVSYLPLGRDATIAYDYIDLIFKNNRDHHIFINSQVKGDEITIKIFGDKNPRERVEVMETDHEEVEPHVEIIIDDDFKEGEKELIEPGSLGHRVTVWRVFYQGEEELEREVLSTDYYRPVAAVYHVGKGTKKEDVLTKHDEYMEAN